MPHCPIHLRKTSGPRYTMSTKQGSGRVTWSSLPRKDQLFVLCLVRFSEPVVRLSIVSYIYYQLRSLDESLSSPEIVKQAAWLQTVFMISQCVSSWFLGRLADSPRGGRKLVTMVSLLGSCEFTYPWLPMFSILRMMCSHHMCCLWIYPEFWASGHVAHI